MIPLLQMKTADTAHTAIFASDTRPLPDFWVGPGDEANDHWSSTTLSVALLFLKRISCQV